MRRTWVLVSVPVALPACCVIWGRLPSLGLSLPGRRRPTISGPPITGTLWEADEVMDVKPLGRHKALYICPYCFSFVFVTYFHTVP